MTFSLFRFPVRVHFLFWVSAVLIGQSRLSEPLLMLQWIGIVFFGVLVHELGHAMMGRRYGALSEIHLLPMGGATVWTSGHRFTHWQSFFVSFAGPAVNLAIGGIAALLFTFGGNQVPFVHQLLGDLMITNLVWGLFNLVPVVGLDGGHMMLAVAERFLGLRGRRWAFVVSIFVAAGLLVLAFLTHSIIAGVLFLILGYQSYRAWQAESEWSEKIRDRAKVEQGRPLEPDMRRAWAALESEDARTVRQLAETMPSRASNDDERFEVAHLLAWGRLLTGDPRGAQRALAGLPRGRMADALLEGAVALAIGRSNEAVPPLVEAIRGRSDDFVATRLAKAIAQSGRIGELEGLLLDDAAAREVGNRPFRIVITELLRAGRHSEAARVGQLLFERFGEAIDAFNVACAEVRVGRAHDALSWLGKALDAGLPDPTVLDTDHDLATLRTLPEWPALRARAGLGEGDAARG